MPKSCDDISFSEDTSFHKIETSQSTLELSEGQINADIVNPLDIQFKKQLLPNLLSNIAYFILSFLIGILLVPYFVDTLGYAAYGLIPLATSITSYVTLIIDALNIPVSRYLSIDLQRGDGTKANVTYSTVVIGTLVVILVLLPIGVIIAWCAPALFDIGNVVIEDVIFLFLFIILSVLIRAWNSNFMATLFAYNRLDLRNYSNIIYYVSYVGVLLLFFNCICPSLFFVGVGNFVGAVVALIVSIIFSRKVVPYLKVDRKRFSGKLFLEIVRVSVWSLIDRIGCVLNGTIALFAANLILGPYATADYGIANTVYSASLALIELITVLFVPMIYSYVSKRDIKGLTMFSSSAIKIIAILSALLVGLICIFIPQILTVWMGESYTYLSPLISIVVFSVLVWATVSPIASYGVAFLKVRIPALSAVFTGGINILLIVLLCPVFGIYGIALGTVVAAVLHAWVIVPLYYAYITHVPWYTYIFAMYKSVLYLIPLLSAGFGLTLIIDMDLMWTAVIVGLVLMIGYMYLAVRFILKHDERELLRSVLPERVSSHISRRLL